MNRRVPRIVWAVLHLAAGVLLVGCNGQSPTTPTAAYNEHEWIEASRLVPGARSVVLSMPGHLTIEQGPSEALSIRGDMTLVPNIVTTVRGGVLAIGLDSGVYWHIGRPPEFVLSTPTLESAELAEYGVISGSGLEVERLSLRLTGRGDLDFSDLRASELRVTTAHDEGSVRVSGHVDTQIIELSGIADYEARDLHSSRAQVHVSGIGSATLRVEDHLTVTITASGSVYYLGDPEVDSTIDGSGQVVKLGT